MIDVKGIFNGGLNLDDNLYVVPKDSYVDALNVTTDAIEGSNDRAITNIVGNRLVQYDFPTVALFPKVINISLFGEYARISFTGLILANTVITITLKDSNDDIITIGSYTVQDGDTFSDIYNGLRDNINETGAPGVISASSTSSRLQIGHEENTYITEDNVEIACSEGENMCIGTIPNNLRNTVVYFIWNSIGFHSVLEYNNTNRTISPIFINLTDSDNVDVLGFDKDKKITSVNIYNRDEIIEEGGDLLFFIDSLGRPTTIDIKRFKNKEYSPVTRDILDVCKRPPLFPPVVQYGNDTSEITNSTRNNNLRNRLFRFKYRYVYDNNEKSVCSPISTVPLPYNILNQALNSVPTNNNKVDIQLNTGDKDVKSVELLMSYVLKSNDWSDFALVENINKKELSLTSRSKTNLSDDPIPLTNITSISFSGIVFPGILIEVKLQNVVTNELDLVAEYTTVEGDSISDIVNGLVASAGVIALVTATNNNGVLEIEYPWATYIYNSTIITQPTAELNNLSFIYPFYNNGTYPVIDVAESIQLFDYVPDNANAQEMPNGNVLLYGGITEGYDRTLNPNVVNEILTVSGGSPTGGLQYKIISNGGLPLITVIEFSGIPLIGTEIELFGITPSSTITQYANYETVEDDDANSVAFKMAESFNSTYPPSVGSGATSTTTGRLIINWGFPATRAAVFNNLLISPPDFTSADNSIPTFLFSTTRRLGISYFDKKGKTNGILYSGELNFPDYNEDENDLILVPYINTKVYHKPPIWAHSYGFYLTKEATQFLYWECIKVEEDSDFIFFNISNLAENQKLYPTTTQVLSYTFQDGDRVRLIKRVSETSPELFSVDHDAAVIGQVVDPIVNDTPPAKKGTFIKIKKSPPFDIVDFSDDKFIIQLYRPVQQSPSQENTVYYEYGQQYGIGNSGEDTRYHLGMVTDQGIVPSDVIKCDVTVVTNPLIENQDISTLTFSGIPFVGTEIAISIEILPSTNIPLASYIVQQDDTVDSIVTSLFNQLSTHVGTYLISATRNGNDIFLTYYNTAFSLNQSNVSFTYPAADTIPAEFNFYEGDVYVRPRRITLYDGQPTSSIGFEQYNTLDRNFVDDYISAVNSIDGRSSVIDINARKAYYSTMVRFGQAYQPNTNINGLNRFFPNNFDEYDYSYGDIMRFKVRDRFVRVFQKFKVGQVPLYAQILKEQNKENLVVTDRLLNPIQYYVGDLGIGEHAESLISYNFADYFTSNIKGIIGRVSNDGVKFLSIDHKVDSWATSNLPLRTGNYKVYGGLDQRIGNYVISLEATDTQPAVTLVYDLDLNVFSTFLSYYPEMMTVLGTLFISFKNGNLWTHDNPTYNSFYGSQHDSTISVVFNQEPLNRKTFLSVSEISSRIWDVPQMNTDLNSYGNVKMQSNLVDSDFVQLEGNYEAAILRDANSIGGVLEGDSMKGKIMTMKFRASQPTSLVSLNLVSLRSINSPLNAR